MTHQGTHTLLVTPVQEWSLSLHGHLSQHGFAPLTLAPDGHQALALFYQLAPPLVLLDLHLPDGNAVDLCVEMLLAQPSLKIVLVVEANTKPPLAALHAGVTGCIQRDFPPAAWPGLLTYIMGGGMAFNRTILEAALAEGWSAQKRQPPLTIGPLHIDLAQHLVLYGSQRIELTPREFALLIYLARNPDRVITFDQLLNEAWGFGADNGAPAQVRLYIARLRRKLLEEAQTPDFILTERGVGYRLHSEALHQALTPPHQHSPHKNGVHPLSSAA